MIYLHLLLTFFKIGAFTFGGGYAMLPLIQEEVLKNNWLPLQDIINFIAVSESTPGPFAINMATYVGMETGGFWGAVCATLGVVLPSFIVITIIASFFEKFKQNRTVEGIMSGLRPAVIGLMASAVVSVGKTVFFASGISLAVFGSVLFWFSALVFAVMTYLSFKKLHPVAIIGISALAGIIAGYIFNF
jgi:chromate transporter